MTDKILNSQTLLDKDGFSKLGLIGLRDKSGTSLGNNKKGYTEMI